MPVKYVSLKEVVQGGPDRLATVKNLPYYVGFFGFFRRFAHMWAILRNKAVAAKYE